MPVLLYSPHQTNLLLSADHDAVFSASDFWSLQFYNSCFLELILTTAIITHEWNDILDIGVLPLAS